MSENPGIDSEDRRSLIILAILSLLVGAASGLVCALFRLTLVQADRLRGSFVAWAQHEGVVGLLLVVGVLAVATAIAAWLVRRFSPDAAGSGIPQVEEALMLASCFAAMAVPTLLHVPPIYDSLKQRIRGRS